jgi:hypothetical protein
MISLYMSARAVMCSINEDIAVHIIWAIRQVLQVLLALLLSNFLTGVLDQIEPSTTGAKLAILGGMALVTAITIIALFVWFPQKDEDTKATTTTKSTHTLNNRLVKKQTTDEF